MVLIYRLHLVGDKQFVKILDGDGNVVYRNILYTSIDFNAEGLVILNPEKVVIPLRGFTWDDI